LATPAAASSGLTSGQKAGIIVGSFCFAALIAILLFFFLRHRREHETRRRRDTHPAPPIPSNTTLNLIMTDPAQLRQILQNPNDLRMIADGNPLGRLAIEGTQAQYLPRGQVYDTSIVTGA
jgi:hypothetical protein